MQFLFPSVLWALLALAIPIIIHLFHFRRFKKVYFTNVKFLKEIKEEKSTRNKLRNLLILLSRLLALAFLVFAFAQPFISRDNQTKKGKNYVSIFVDNSFSMMASSEDVPLIDKAKKKAEEIIKAYGASDQFQIISHELKGSQTRWINQDNTIDAIEAIELSPEVNPLSKVLGRQKTSAPTDGNHVIYYLSDFQKSISDLELDIDTTTEINLLPFQAVKESNVAIDSAWFESVVPSLNQNNKIYVRVKNFSDEDKDDVRLSLIQNGQTRPEGTLNIPANSSKIDTINLLFNNTGWQNIEIKVDDFPMQFDDKYFVTFNVKEKVKVLAINDGIPNRYLSALLKGLSQFELTNVNTSQIKYDQFKSYDLIVLSGLKNISSGLTIEIKQYINNGGNAVVFPAADASVENYNKFLSALNANSLQKWSKENRSVYKINTAEFVFDNVYQKTGSNLKLPRTTGNFEMTNYSARGGETLLNYRDGSPFVTKYLREKGHLYVSAAPLDKKYNDLVLNAEVFVPMMYKMAFSSRKNEKIGYTIGNDNNTEVANTINTAEVVYKISGEEEFIPGQINKGNSTILSFNDMISKAGFYDVNLTDEKVKGLAFNYDRIESSLDYMNAKDLLDAYGDKANVLDNTLKADLTTIIQEKDKGISLWRWCLILALMFLAMETLLLRFWKI